MAGRLHRAQLPERRRPASLDAGEQGDQSGLRLRAQRSEQSHGEPFDERLQWRRGAQGAHELLLQPTLVQRQGDFGGQRLVPAEPRPGLQGQLEPRGGLPPAELGRRRRRRARRRDAVLVQGRAGDRPRHDIRWRTGARATIQFHQFLIAPYIGNGGSPVDQYLWVDDLKRSEEHTSELQSLAYLVCRLLLEKKKKQSKQ